MTGHVYQGPFKSFPVEDDDHLFTVCRYVERMLSVPAWWSGRKTGCGVVPGLSCTRTTLARYRSAPGHYRAPRIGWLVSING